MGPLRNIFQATLTWQGFEIVALAVSFIAVPLYLGYLGAERYGLYLTAQAWAGYMTLGNAGTSQATMILISHASGRDDPSELSRIVRTSLALSMVAAALVLLVSLGGFFALRADTLSGALKLNHPEVPGLMLAIGLQVIAAFLFSTFYDLLIGLQQVSRATVLQGVNRTASQFVSLGVAVAGGSVGQITGASALVTVAVGVVCAALTWRAHPKAFGPAQVTRDQVLLQLRTGAKSFGLQVGTTLAGTAPTLALAIISGPASVPLFAVPARLLSVGTGIVTSFSALLQPAFGEAYARADLAWIRSALSQIWDKTLLFMTMASALLVGVGGTFIVVWTAGRLEVSATMLVSVAIAGSATVALAPVKFFLSGINQHRWAAIAEIANGVLAITFAFVAVSAFSADWVGWGVFAASACTSMWMLPAQAKLHLGMGRLVPSAGRLLKMAACALAVYAAARLMAAAGGQLVPGSAWAALMLSAVGATATCAIGVVSLKLIEWRELSRRFRVQRT